MNVVVYELQVRVGGHNVGHIKTPALLVDCCVSNLYLCPVFWESCASSKIDCPYKFVETNRRNSIVLALKVMWIFTFRFLSWLALLCLYETDVAVTFYSLTFCIGILLS